MNESKRYCVGDVTTNRILGRYATAEGAAKATTGNPRDLLAFHEAHKENLGMIEAAFPDEPNIKFTCSVIDCGAEPNKDSRQCEAHEDKCARCGKNKQSWQVYCGSACSAQSEARP